MTSILFKKTSLPLHMLRINANMDTGVLRFMSLKSVVAMFSLCYLQINTMIWATSVHLESFDVSPAKCKNFQGKFTHRKAPSCHSRDEQHVHEDKKASQNLVLVFCSTVAKLRRTALLWYWVTTKVRHPQLASGHCFTTLSRSERMIIEP